MKIKISPIALFGAILLLCVLMVVGNTLFRPAAEGKIAYRYLGLFAQVAALVRTDYVEEVEPTAKFPGAYSALLGALDDASAYLDVEKTRLYQQYLLDKVCGIGINGVKEDEYFQITDVWASSPAGQAGIKAGDFIKAVNRKSIYGLGYWEMVLSMVTERPAYMELAVFTPGTLDPVIKKIETRPINSLGGVTRIVEPLEHGVLWLHLQRLDAACALEIGRALKNTGTNTQLILDFRGYRGGDWDSLTAICRVLLPGEVSLTLQIKNSKETHTLGSDQNHRYGMVGIINHSTVLYGELLALLCKSANPEMIFLGKKTGAMVSRQKWIPLEDGSSILVTDALFQLSGDKTIADGITPQVQLAASEFDSIIQRGVNILKSGTASPPQDHERNQTKN